MSIPPESIEVGRCYLTTSGQVRRVLGFLPQRVRFERRVRTTGSDWGWVAGLAERRAFTLVIEREVPFDWTPEMDEAGD
jgi:hypothetical protein